jgi:hypothetical protein
MTETHRKETGDERIDRYCDKLATDRNYLKETSGRVPFQSLLESEGIEFEAVADFRRDYAGLRGGKVEVYRYKSPNSGSTVYVAEWSERVAIDDVLFTSLSFSSEPTKHDVKIIELLNQFVRRIRLGKLQTEFDCWECGQRTHILDSGHIETTPKLSRVISGGEARYCGC